MTFGGVVMAAGVDCEGTEVCVVAGADAVAVPPAGDAVDVAAGVGALEQVELETVLVSIVTAPFRANALPDTLAPVVRLMLVSARMFPMNAVRVPSVAELPICQNALQG
jgi:hypothetical protein